MGSILPPNEPSDKAGTIQYLVFAVFCALTRAGGVDKLHNGLQRNRSRSTTREAQPPRTEGHTKWLTKLDGGFAINAMGCFLGRLRPKAAATAAGLTMAVRADHTSCTS